MFNNSMINRRRYFAGFLDLAIVTALILGFNLIVDVYGTWIYDYISVIKLIQVKEVILILLIWFYFAGMEATPLRATICKKVFGVIVTDMEGNRAPLWKLTIRLLLLVLIGWIHIIISAVFEWWTLFIPLVEFKNGQLVHDKLTGTIVRLRSSEQ